MGLVTSAGIGAGIDAETIIEALINAERFSKEGSFRRIEIRSNTAISGIGKLKSALSSLQDSLANLTSNNFNARIATSADQTQLTATAGSNSSQGTFDVTIVNTATITKLSSSSIAGDSTTVLGAGNLTFQNAALDNFTIAVGATDSLADIVAAINGASDNIGITATLVNGDSGTKIIYRGNDSGLLNDFTATNDNANLAQISDGNGGALVIDSTAIDAQISIAGLTITSDSNNFTDPVLGVNITLNSAAIAGVISVTVDKDPDTVKTNIEQFVTDYNNYIQVASELGSASLTAPGELVGDSTLRNVTSRIQNTISTIVASSPTGFNTLSSIGISTQRDGTISLDSTILEDSLQNNFNGVGNLFHAADGIGSILESVIEPYAQFSGFLDKRTDSLQIILKRVGDDRVKLELRLDTLESSLRSKFAATDTIVSKFNFTSRFLEQQFASLAGIYEN